MKKYTFFVVTFTIITSLTVFTNCSKTKSQNSNADTLPEIEQLKEQVSTENSSNISQTVNSIPEKNYITMEEFISQRTGLYEKGGIALFGSGLIYDVPTDFKREIFNIYGIDGDYFPPNEPYNKIEIKFLPGVNNFLNIMIPEEIYNTYPNLYVEAEHDGKTFIYDQKRPLNFNKEYTFDETLIGYRTKFVFNNRNLYSTNYDYNIFLKDCNTDKIIATQTLTLKFYPQQYVVYSDEYENPFIPLENNNLESGKTYNLIYFGKGSKWPDLGTMAVFSYNYTFDSYQNSTHREKILYIPFFAEKTESDQNGICHLQFSIKESGIYKIDFYNVETGEILRNDAFNYIQVKYKNIKHVEQPQTKWKVNTPEGLKLRNSPWGEKLALLEDGTELIQTEDALYPFYDYIDTVQGFWIPVKVVNKTNELESLSKENLYCKDINETDGWVFSGYLEKM